MNIEKKEKLAIHGGTPLRKMPMPPRMAIGPDEMDIVNEALEHYQKKQVDLPYDGDYKIKLCKAFSEYMGGGYTDAVSSGTAAVYTSLLSLNLPKGSEVIISPVTDSAPLNCVILQGYTPVISDSKPESYNAGLEQLLEKTTDNTSCYLLIHAGGEPMDDIEDVVHEAHKRDIKVLEDCSQAIGATLENDNTKMGAYGDIAAFSTMYRKNLMSGSSGGIVFTKNKYLYHMALAHANRGREIWNVKDVKDPSHALFPALNFNTNEISCAICLSSLKRLDDTNEKRRQFLRNFINVLKKKSKFCSPSNFHDGFAPFFFPIYVNTENLSCSKKEFAQALIAEGVPLHPHFSSVISMWKWAEPYIKHGFSYPNAEMRRDRSFNLFLNEKYTEKEANDIVECICKVENYYRKEYNE